MSPGLVGLAINYTLLTPVYLQWVVRFWAELEMYFNAVERVAHYADVDAADAADADGASLISFSSSSRNMMASMDVERCRRKSAFLATPTPPPPPTPRLIVAERSPSAWRWLLCCSLGLTPSSFK